MYRLRGERLEGHTFKDTLNYFGFNCVPVGAYFTTMDTRTSRSVSFGGRLIQSNGKVVLADRLGSVRVDETGAKANYYPYGEQQSGAMGDGREKFGTYTRESSTGLDYANQRYYASVYGRFNTPDPYRASSGASDPGSWNRYSYTQGDPVNFNDATGLARCSVVGVSHTFEDDVYAYVSRADIQCVSKGGTLWGTLYGVLFGGSYSAAAAAAELTFGAQLDLAEQDHRPPPDPTCHVEIKFSEVRPLGFGTGYNHTMLQFFDSGGLTQVIDGGPVFSAAAGKWLLTPEVTPNGTYQNAGSSSSFVSTLRTSELCISWGRVAGIARNFPSAIYGGLTSNSNSLTSYLWGQLGQGRIGPPPGPNSTPGWNEQISWYTPSFPF